MNFLDLTVQYKSIKKEIDRAIKRVLESAVFIGGKEVEELEKEIADFCGAKYAVSVNSGTDALFLSLKALGVGSGDEVITTPFTFIATAEVVANCGAKLVFIDIDSKTFNINPKKIEEYLKYKIQDTKYKIRPKVIIPVHLFGQMADMTEIMRIAKKYKLYVIEDAAQAIGAKCQMSNIKYQMSGSVGDAGCFSFFPSKNLGAFGDGGIVITNNKKLADKIRLLRNHGSSPRNKYLNLALGTNSRLDALQAAILRVKLRHLRKWIKQKQKIAEFYNKELKEIKEIAIPDTKYKIPRRTSLRGRQNTNFHVFHQYTIRAKSRDELQKYLKEKEIPAMIYYSLPLHLQPAFKYLGHKKGDFPEAEKAAKEVLSLPIYPELSEKDQNFIIEKIKEFYKK